MNELKETIHYLKVLKESYAIFQPEIRKAIDHALDEFETKIRYLKSQRLPFGYRGE